MIYDHVLPSSPSEYFSKNLNFNATSFSRFEMLQGEYLSGKFLGYLKEYGIVSQWTPSGTS